MSYAKDFEYIRQIAWDAVGTDIETADKALVKIHEFAKEHAARAQQSGEGRKGFYCSAAICNGCGHVYMERPSSCDCGNDESVNGFEPAAVFTAAEITTPPADKPEGEWVKCAEMDDELRWILGRPNFACFGIAERLREMGHDIERKAESEQAAAIHWMMSLYVQHGADWLKKGKAILEARPAAPDMGGSE